MNYVNSLLSSARQMLGYGRDGYEEGSYSETYSSSYGCCPTADDLLPLVALIGLALFTFYLIIITSTTTQGRRKRALRISVTPDEDNDLDVTLDGPAWLSMIHELWEQDGVSDDPSCAYHTLCRMNRIAAESGGQGTWAAHLSSVPLSYLLHHRHHDSGFLGYLDAAMVGRSGANCTALFNGCSRLQ